ncbi:MAG: hypothetical protein KJ882_03385 [Proteobacteria bacterium]|nr:hypothetical protein [Pseudomonadota bacterium]MBU4009786.1 hypothetical protein [Pseudomonadota bacterium]
MKKILLPLSILLIFYGCNRHIIESTSPNTVKQIGLSYHYNQYEIDIISEPLGVTIEWDNGYIGKTPLKYTYNGTRRRNGPDIIIIATPTEPGQYVQKKRLTASVPIPRTIFFNTYVGPVTQPDKVDVDVKITPQKEAP